MRLCPAVLSLLLLGAAAVAVEDGDVLFFAPFEDSSEATFSAGSGDVDVIGTPRFGPGVRGKAVILEPEALLTYALHDNVIPDEGTIMMWAKPEWPSDDGQFHRFFRASTGNFGGKALNAIMLYKYIGRDRVLFYTSNGQETTPSEGRTLAFRDDLKWEPGVWVHMAATWSATLANTEMYLYINGERASAAGGAVFVPEQEPETFEVGGPAGAGTTWFDDVLVFQRPLLAREVREIYESYRKGTAPDPVGFPFAARPELQLEPYVAFGRDKLVVQADFRGARRELGGRDGSVQVAVSGRGRQVSARTPATAVGLARVEFDYDRIGAGPSVVKATLRDAGGKTLRTGQIDYVVPKRPPWLGNNLGKAERVLPPWTPLHAAGNATEMWGRRYVQDGSPLLSQVISQERALLRKPPVLTIGWKGKTANLEAEPSGPPTGGEAVVTRKWVGRLGPLTCAITSRIEFDGFMLLDCTFTPGKDQLVELMELVIPLRDDAATLYHHANGTWTDLSDAGGIGPRGWSKPLQFVPYVWLGTENGGLAWFCEHNQHWSNADESRAVEIAHGDEGVDLIIRFIDKPTTLTKPLEVAFGFMATPVKPMPEGWRDWRQMFISALNLEGFVKRGWAVPYGRNIGALWNNRVGSFSYLPANPAQMRGEVSLLRDNGWQTVLSYFALDYTQTGTPDYIMMERDWRRNPYTEGTYNKETNFSSVCNASTWADFLVWAIAKTMDETGTDGPYLDCSNPNFCQSAEHGCAPGRYPLFATRELQRRIYAVAKEKRGDRGFVYNHNSENNIITTFAFSDAVLNGEQYNRKDLRTLTFAKFRAELSPQPYGVPTFLLPTLIKFQPNKQEKMPGAEFLAFPLLHDVICLRSWLGRDSQELLRNIQQIKHDFGVAEAEFLPYWDNERELSVSPDGVTVSAYLRQDGKAILLIAQAAEKNTFELTLRGRLTTLQGCAAYNALTKAPLRWDKGKLLWPLPDKNVQLVIVEGT